MITNLKTQKMKFSHKAELKLSSTNLDLKEGEGCLAKHGDGRNGEFAWRNGHGGQVLRNGEGKEMRESERKCDEVRESEVGECGKHEIQGFYMWVNFGINSQMKC